MREPESRFERIEAIGRQLSAHPEGQTTGELARLYHVDPATIYRDLTYLQSVGTVLTKEKRRWRLDVRRSLYGVKLSSHEMMALYLAARLLSRQSDEHNPHVVTALEKLADALCTRSPLMASHIANAAVAVRERPTRETYVESLETLTLAWVQGRKVRLRYRSYTKGETTERVFAPYFIEPSSIGYACYVIGFDELRAAVRTLRVERIYDAQLTDDRYDIPATFDPLHLLASAWGVIWSDDGETEVTLRFAPAVVRRVKESTWHHTQRIEELPDGSCLFTVRVGSTMEFKPWVRQWGGAVEVVRPITFRQDVITEVSEMARMYGVG